MSLTCLGPVLCTHGIGREGGLDPSANNRSVLSKQCQPCLHRNQNFCGFCDTIVSGRQGWIRCRQQPVVRLSAFATAVGNHLSRLAAEASSLTPHHNSHRQIFEYVLGSKFNRQKILHTKQCSSIYYFQLCTYKLHFKEQPNSILSALVWEDIHRIFFSFRHCSKRGESTHARMFWSFFNQVTVPKNGIF